MVPECSIRREAYLFFGSFSVEEASVEGDEKSGAKAHAFVQKHKINGLCRVDLGPSLVAGRGRFARESFSSHTVC